MRQMSDKTKSVLNDKCQNMSKCCTDSVLTLIVTVSVRVGLLVEI